MANQLWSLAHGPEGQLTSNQFHDFWPFERRMLQNSAPKMAGQVIERRLIGVYSCRTLETSGSELLEWPAAREKADRLFTFDSYISKMIVELFLIGL
jgi:hypothetical protein